MLTIVLFLMITYFIRADAMLLIILTWALGPRSLASHGVPIGRRLVGGGRGTNNFAMPLAI